MRLLPLLLLFSASFAAPALAATPSEKITFVMVHGATARGGERKKCGQCLTDDGHTVYRATLTRATEAARSVRQEQRRPHQFFPAVHRYLRDHAQPDRWNMDDHSHDRETSGSNVYIFS